MELDNPILQLGEQFLESELKGIKVSGIAEMFQQAYNEAGMDIEVSERRNIIYLIRKEDKSSE